MITIKAKNKKTAVIGPFDEDVCGQTVKVRTVYSALCSNYGETIIKKVNTSFWGNHLLSCSLKVFKSCFVSKNFVVLLAHNGIRTYSSVFLPILKLFKKNVFYCVIGGWLPEYLKQNPKLKNKMILFDQIFVETDSMKNALAKSGLENVTVMPNCKELEILKEDKLVYNTDEPLRLCTFSRVMKEKGIEDAVNAVKRVNETLGRTAYALDIYGNIESGQEEWFEDLKVDFPDFIEYKGSVPFDESVSVIKDYYLLLFPTRFFTEGIPGTIIDAYAAGVPALCSKWENFSDLVEENKTGFGFEFLNNDDFYEMLLKLVTDTNRVFSMKKNCIKKAKSYLPGLALKPLFERLY